MEIEEETNFSQQENYKKIPMPTFKCPKHVHQGSILKLIGDSNTASHFGCKIVEYIVEGIREELEFCNGQSDKQFDLFTTAKNLLEKEDDNGQDNVKNFILRALNLAAGERDDRIKLLLKLRKVR